MPVSNKVHRLYKHLLDKGFDKESAARIAQAKTKLSLKTGKKPKRKKKKL